MTIEAEFRGEMATLAGARARADAEWPGLFVAVFEGSDKDAEPKQDSICVAVRDNGHWWDLTDVLLERMNHVQ